MLSALRAVTRSRAFSTNAPVETFIGAIGNTPLVRRVIFLNSIYFLT